MSTSWAGIVRVSHVGGRSGDSFHADRDQVRDIEDHIRRIGGRVVILPPELDVSGGARLEDRPSLLAAVEGVERGDYDGIVVSYLSRLGRSIREQLRAWDRVEAAGGKIIVVRENIDTSTSTGKLQRTMLLGIAEHELDMHKERFENLRRAATEAGIWQRRQTPIGYERNGQTRKLVPDERADEVRQAFVDAVAGVPIIEIARRLGMTPNGIRNMLRNRVYLGELSVGEYVNAAAHPAIVDADTFALASRKRPRPARNPDHQVALLAGLVRCAGCGHVMPRGGNAKTLAYTCARHHSGATCPAPAAITMARLDAHVEAIALRELAKLNAQATDPRSTVTQARATLQDAERELAVYLESVSASLVGKAAFTAGARTRKEAVDEAKAGLQAVLEANAAPFSLTGDEAWNVLDAARRNAVLRTLIAGVVVRKSGKGGNPDVNARVRVMRAGADIAFAHGTGGRPAGIVPVPLLHADHPDVLRIDAP